CNRPRVVPLNVAVRGLPRQRHRVLARSQIRNGDGIAGPDVSTRAIIYQEIIAIVVLLLSGGCGGDPDGASLWWKRGAGYGIVDRRVLASQHSDFLPVGSIDLTIARYSAQIHN